LTSLTGQYILTGMTYTDISAPVLVIDDLWKRFPGKQGVQANGGISLTVGPGEVVGLLGHNGAGKTTLVNSLVGLVRPDKGSITLAGIDAIVHPEQARLRAAVQAQTNVSIAGLTPREAVTLVGRIRGLGKSKARARADELMVDLDIQEWADRPASKSSGGIVRMAAFCMAAAAPAPLHVFDEPTNDIDPARRILLWRQVRELADRGGAVLLATHNVHEAAQTVDRVVILGHGRVLAQGTVAEIVARCEVDDLEAAYLVLAGAEEGGES